MRTQKQSTGLSAGIGVSVKIDDNTQAVVAAEKKASFANIRQAAFSIRKDVVSTIKVRAKRSTNQVVDSRKRKRRGPQIAYKESSNPGDPPLTKGWGKNLKNAIFVGMDLQKRGFETALIGPRASFVGTSGELHELGKSRAGADYPERPFMRPALLRAVPRMAGIWSGSIGQS